MYSAGKFAVEGLTEALRFEVRHFGIKVALVEPGDIRTQDCRTKILRTQAYAPHYTQAVQVYEADEARGYPAEKIGALIERIICTPQPRLRYPVGSALQRAEFFLKGLVPYSLYEWALSKIYKV
jgi:NAD(P)-dependent dehydrogenase (short-subunit alcohol dehydrogenase family)